MRLELKLSLNLESSILRWELKLLLRELNLVNGAKAHIELVLPFIIAAKIAVLGKVLLLLNINISVTYVTNS